MLVIEELLKGRNLDLHYRKYHVGFVLNIGESHRGNHNDREIEKPIRTRRKRVGWSANFERNDF
jgi:hypothetical protein